MNNEELKEELKGIKKELKALANILVEYKILEQKIIQLDEKLISTSKRHDEGRKVLHKRLDVYAKVFFWFGSTLFTGMAGVIYTLLNRIYGG